MAEELRYVGPPVAEDDDVAYRGYVAEAMSADITAAEIDALIADKLSDYATKDYVAERDALNATPAYVDAGDATRLKLAHKDAPNGVPALDQFGRVDRARINAPSTQRYPKGLWTPTSYGTGQVSVSDSSEVQLFPPVTVTDPGYPYRLAVFGSIDAFSGSTDRNAPRIVVRVGSASGPIIASGIGCSENYGHFGSDMFDRELPNLGPGWSETWTGPGNGHARTDGTTAIYSIDGTSNARVGLFRRVGADAVTATNYQTIRWQNNLHCEEGSAFGTSARNLIHGRMSADGTHWAGFALDAGNARFAYRAGGNMVLGSPVTCPNDASAQFYAYLGTEQGERHFRLVRNGQTVLEHHDASGVTSMGPDYRGWGFGFRAGNYESFGISTRQARPASLHYIYVYDNTPDQSIQLSYAPTMIMPDQVASQPVRTGATTLHVRLMRHLWGSTTYSVWGGYDHHPNLSVLAIPA